MYNGVHCLKCGEICTADVMGFDFDQIMRYALTANQEKWRTEPELRVFSDVSLGLYFTYYVLMRKFNVENAVSDVYIRPDDIIWYLKEYRNIQLPMGKDEREWEDWHQSPEFREACRMLRQLDANARLRNTELAEGLWSIFMYLLQHRDEKEPLLHVQVLVKLSEDDMEQEYPSGMEVWYDDEHRIFIGNMVCPKCGRPFHVKAGSCREYIIGMLGSARVGKTAYLAALMNELKPPAGKSAIRDIRLIVDNDAGYKRFEESILTSYRNGWKIEKTPVQDEMVPLFTVQMQIGIKKALFTFVDMPGEALVPSDGEVQNASFILEKRPILKHTDLFWMCIDPAQIDMRVSFDDEMVEKIEKVIRDIKPVLETLNQKKRLKAALMVTKSDCIPTEANLFDSSGDWNQLLYQDERYRWEPFANFSGQVKEYLDSDHVKDFEADIREMFSDVNYFAVAAYGKRISGREETEILGVGNMPSHILDPFIWTLAVLELIVLEREERIQKKMLFGFLVSNKTKIVYLPVEISSLFR